MICLVDSQTVVCEPPVAWGALADQLHGAGPFLSTAAKLSKRWLKILPFPCVTFLCK